MKRHGVQPATPEILALRPENPTFRPEALRDDSRKIRGEARAAHEIDGNPLGGILVKQDARGLFFTDGLHGSAKAFSARNQMHPETFARVLDPSIGARLVERAEKHNPLSFGKLGVKQRDGCHHLHEREMRNKEHDAFRGLDQAGGASQHALIKADATADFFG